MNSKPCIELPNIEPKMTIAVSSFVGKRVLVTGGAMGIGRAVVDRLVAEKAVVSVIDRNKDALDALQRAAPGVATQTCDVENWNETRQVVQSLGPMDHLVNNAGIFSFIPFMHVQEKDFEKIYSINLKSVINISQVVAAGMLENGVQGSIVNVASLSSQMATMGLSLYGSSKAALSNLTKTMALELGKAGGIRVNAICPGFVDTSMTHNVLNREQIDKILKRSIERRLVKPEEVANLVAFLLSKNSSMVNGQSVFIDGGFSVI